MTDVSGAAGPAASSGEPRPPTPPEGASPIYEHVPHPRLAQRRQKGPVKVGDAHPLGINGRIAVLLTKGVGTMVCAYVFAVLAILGFPGLTISLSSVSYSSAGVTGQQYVQWVSQTFIQLVMLSIIMVGQNILSAAADLRSSQTYEDAEAILHECLELQAHLAAQDVVLQQAMERLPASGPSEASAA
jgi:hypothetical protein